jgi:hypothetical protein
VYGVRSRYGPCPWIKLPWECVSRMTSLPTSPHTHMIVPCLPQRVPATLASLAFVHITGHLCKLVTAAQVRSPWQRTALFFKDPAWHSFILHCPYHPLCSRHIAAHVCTPHRRHTCPGCLRHACYEGCLSAGPSKPFVPSLQTSLQMTHHCMCTPLLHTTQAPHLLRLPQACLL